MAQRRGLRFALLACIALLSVGCEHERAGFRATACVSWTPDVASLVETQCASCHVRNGSAATYPLESYLDVLGTGRDEVPNAVVDDPDSLLLTTLRDASEGDPHHGLDEAHATLRAWVVDCRLDYGSDFHEPGILNPHDASFHGKALRASGYDFDKCADCHGEAFDGGEAQASCIDCHEAGPTDCTTCHGALGMQGAHTTHLLWLRERATDTQTAGLGGFDVTGCDSCHVVPTNWRDVGHVFTDAGRLDPAPAEVVFSDFANQRGADVVVPPAGFDATNQRCNNIYCHGGAFEDTKATDSAPVWAKPDTELECTSCHGMAPETHASDECVTCHQQVIDGAGMLVDAFLHIDGAVQTGRVGGDDPTCGTCHSATVSPFVDLSGNTSRTAPTVGAHRAHVVGRKRLMGTMSCETCHAVPETVDAPGHIDSTLPAEVFPEGLASPAFGGDAMPRFDRETLTCRDVACHGGGMQLAMDTSASIVREPSWVEPTTIACGSCHGIPPDDFHLDTWDLTTCSTCHPSVTDLGDIIVTGTEGAYVSDHINGVVDVLF